MARTKPTCRRCTECVGEDHHWMLDCTNEGGEPVEPFFTCKHCDYTCLAVECEACGEDVPVDITARSEPFGIALLCAFCVPAAPKESARPS